MAYRVDPPGARSCRSFYLQEGVAESDLEQPPFQWESAESFAQGVLFDEQSSLPATRLLAKYQRKLELAQQGSLRFGRSRRNDVDVMKACPDVLEIKYSDLPPECDKQRKWLRLYFSEPVAHQGMLIALALRLKYADNPDMQTQDALDAYNYLQQHLAGRESEGSRHYEHF